MLLCHCRRVFIAICIFITLSLTACGLNTTKVTRSNEKKLEALLSQVVRLEVPLQSNTLLETFSIGSGFLLTESSVVTCAHVLSGRKEHKPISVYISGKRHEASLLDIDEELDIAVISLNNPAPYRVELKTMPTSPEIGEQVYIAGFPLSGVITDKLPTVTAGIVSAKNRSIYLSGKKTGKLIQLDAVASEGNSGGPASLPNGKIFGMVTVAASGQNAEWRGATFALPIEQVLIASYEILRRADSKKNNSDSDKTWRQSVKTLLAQ